MGWSGTRNCGVPFLKLSAARPSPQRYEHFMRSKLEIKSIWEDDDLFEVEVFASNGRFSGTANCYTLRSEIKLFGEMVDGFPKSLKDKVAFSSSDSNTLSYFSVQLRCIDRSGHVNARIKIAHIIHYSNGKQENDVAEFDMSIEPASVDRFSRSLKKLSECEIGAMSATLIGIS